MHATKPTLHLLPDAPLDDETIKAVACTDRRAAADLVVRLYRDRLFRHAAYILKDYQLAMDVTQEVFIKAMREKRFFLEEFKMKAWLFRVTSNLCFNIRRDKKRRAAILETLPVPTSHGADQLDFVFENETQETMLAAMDTLSENHRAILMLRYYDDLSYAEIADVLQVALGTVMSRLSRAKAQLMDVIDDLRVVEA